MPGEHRPSKLHAHGGNRGLTRVALTAPTSEGYIVCTCRYCLITQGWSYILQQLPNMGRAMRLHAPRNHTLKQLVCPSHAAHISPVRGPNKPYTLRSMSTQLCIINTIGWRQIRTLTCPRSPALAYKSSPYPHCLLRARSSQPEPQLVADWTR